MIEPTAEVQLHLHGPITRIALAILFTATLATAQAKHIPRHKAATESAQSAAAKVTYATGQLTVVANESSLAETLVEIRALTNARVEGMQPKPEDTISGEFGPDTPRAVLSAMLATSHYNFVLLSAPGNPGMVQRIVLSEPTAEPVVAEKAPSQKPVEAKSVAEKPALQSVPATGAADEIGRFLPPEKPSAQVPESAEKPELSPDVARDDNPQAPPSAASAKDISEDDLARTANTSKEALSPDSSDTSHPQPDQDLPTVPATVQICGVTYEASQLANVKVPDRCDTKSKAAPVKSR